MIFLFLNPLSITKNKKGAVFIKLLEKTLLLLPCYSGLEWES